MSTTELAREAHQLLRELIDLQPEERRERLEVLGEGTPLRREVEELLTASERAGPFLEDASFPTDPSDLGPERFVGSQVGGYVLERLLGRGGMGAVFQARQEDPQRTVALKLMNPGLLDQRALSRFRSEVHVLGLLEHPGIARLYASGAWDAGFGGVPWYAMELVEDGQRITDFAWERSLSRTRRLQLFLEACSAVHYGHQKGIIHRDLKPANLLVDREGRVRVIDFGVARVLGEPGQTVTRTTFGGAVGTIRYMSPEQFVGNAGEAGDVRSDVYALGVVLYELLCERHPHDLSEKGFLEAARVVRETPPARLSSHDPSLKGDLEAVVLKAMSRNRELRFQSVGDLARDVERYLEHRPVRAHSPSLWRQLTLFARRNRTVVAVSSTAVLLLLAVSMVSTALAIRLDREVERREKAQLEVERVAYQTSLFAAESAWRNAELQPMRHRLGLAPQSLRDWEWNLLDRLAHPETQPLLGHPAPVSSVRFSPDGTQLASGSSDGTLLLWDVRNRSSSPIAIPAASLVQLTWSNDGQRLAVGTQEGSLLEYERVGTDRFELLRSAKVAEADITGIAYAPNSSLWTVSLDGSVRRLDPDSEDASTLGRELGEQHTIALGPGGDRFLTAGERGLVHTWNIDGESPPSSFRAHETRIYSIAMHPHGKGFLTGARDGNVRRWDPHGEMVWEIEAHGRGVRCVAFHPSGDTFATGSMDNTVALWSFRDGESRGVFRGHENEIEQVEFHPGGSLLATASWDGSVQLLSEDQVVDRNVLRGHQKRAFCVASSPAGTLAASGDEDGRVILWDTNQRSAVHTLEAHEGEVRCMDFRTDGKVLATGGEDGTVALWEVSTGALLRRTEPRSEIIHAVRFVGQAGGFAYAGSEGRLYIESTDEAPRELVGHERGVRVLAVDRGGMWLASGGDDHRVRLWRLDGSEPTQVLEAHKERVFALAFHPEGHRLASAGFDRMLCIWDVETGRLVDSAAGHGQFLYSLAWHPDGHRLAGASWFEAVQIWQAEPLTELLLLHDQPDVIRSVAFSTDGRYLLSAGHDRTVRIWDGAPRGVPGP